METTTPMPAAAPAKVDTPVEVDPKAAAVAAETPAKKGAPKGTIEAAISSLVVNDMAASLAFYVDVLGFKLSMGVDKDHGMTATDPSAWPSMEFAMLSGSGACPGPGELMLEIRNSVSPTGVATGDGPLSKSSALYLRGLDPDVVYAGLPPHVKVLEAPTKQWYGMREVTIEDPNGYIVTLGKSSGEPCEAAEKAAAEGKTA